MESGLRRGVVIGLVGGLLLAGCQKKQKVSPKQHTYLLERVGDVAVVQIYADAFETLPLNQKLLAYYLSQAAIAGRDISTDQTHRYALEIRDLMEEIYLHSETIPADVREKLTEYLKLLWIHSANYNMRTFKKILPRFTFDELQMAAQQALEQGANLSLQKGENLQTKLERLRRSMFDPDYEPFCTTKSPPPGEDILTASANNLYENVTLDEANAFPERYPLNSKLIKVEGVIVELPYRCGNDTIPAGLYASQLRNVVFYLRKALPYAGERQRLALTYLIQYFETGDPAFFKKYNIEWVQDDPEIETILGFIEVYKDARGAKGEYEGIVSMRDRDGSQLMKRLAENAAYYETKMPWADRYKRERFNIPVANAITVLTATGHGGPISWAGINLPNAQEIRQNYGSKSFLLTNVIEAREAARGSIAAEEFLATQAEREVVQRFGGRVSLVFVAMHEVLGHASGRVSPELKDDPSVYLQEYYSTIEEARSDLVALWNMADPQTLKTGIISDARMVEAMYRKYAMGALVQLSRVPEGEVLEEDHMRGQQMIVNYIAKTTGAIELQQRDGKHYLTVVDLERMREGVGQLLAELMRIKAEGDYAAARQLIETYGTRFNPALRDEVVQRVRSIGYPNWVANVTPILKPVTDPDTGEIIDIQLEYPMDLAKQMLAYRHQAAAEKRVEDERISAD